jgi:hypothetical protein
MRLVAMNDTEILTNLLYFLLYRFLSGDVRARGSEGGMVRVWILELSSTNIATHI